MVSSKIGFGIQYKEHKEIDPEDLGHNSVLYEINIFEKPILVSLGKPKYTFMSKNIVYYPIYLISTNCKIKGQIGLFEIRKNESLNILDEDGDIDMSKLDAPLIYGFVSQKYIDRAESDAQTFIREKRKCVEDDTKGEEEKQKAEGKKAEEKKNEEDDSDSDEDEEDKLTRMTKRKSNNSEEVEKASGLLKKGPFIIDNSIVKPKLLTEETIAEANEIKKTFKKSSRNNWIQKFMKNNNYGIHEVESNGDCFFAVIRDAFKQIGQITTVDTLRAILAKEATDTVFQAYLTMFLGFDSNIQRIENEMRKIKKILENDMKSRAKVVRGNATETAKIMTDVEELKKKYAQLNAEKKETESLLQIDVGFVRDIDTIENIRSGKTNLEDFRRYIQTPKFWADSWAISILEKYLNIKIIVLSEFSYNGKSLDSVMNCGADASTDLQKKGIFNPQFYIMTTYSGNHYRLITYKEKRIFTFPEIPYYIKVLVVKKCLERNAGVFYLIQDFRDLKSRLGINPDEGNPDAKNGNGDGDGDEEDDENENELYDPKIVFAFYSAADKSKKPGTGINEKIPPTMKADFTTLGRIADWRKKLDDYWTDALFKLDGHKWASVEHYYQGAKFKKGFPDFRMQFSLDSESDISKDVEMAHKAGDKIGKYKKQQIRPKLTVIDPDFYGERSKEERENAVRAKFTQNDDMKQALLATRNAKLVHFIRGEKPETDNVLMKIRKELQKPDKGISDKGIPEKE